MAELPRALLEQGLQDLELPLAAATTDRLLAYLALLAKWNRAYNLSAIREPAAMVTRHLLDSLAILPWVEGDRLLDVGSGAGLPGIPLAIARPDLAVVCLDSNGKKARFLRQCRLELELTNLEVVEQRVETYQPDTPFGLVTSRAFADVGLFLRLTRHLLAPGGHWLAMKGRLDQTELTEIDAEGVKLQVHRLSVPGLDAERHLLDITRAG